MFNAIKEMFGKRMMRQEMRLVKHVPVVSNLDTLTTIGILFDASGAEEFELVKKYVLYLKELKKKVKAIGYYSTKEPLNINYSKLEYDFFGEKELTWFRRPNNPFVDNFINEEFDVLLDCNIHNHFPLKYIAAVSKSKFKVGPYRPADNDIYDMMIHAEENKGLKYYLRNADIYIQMINSNKPVVIPEQQNEENTKNENEHTR